MKEYARMPGKYVQAYARPQAIQSILNVESSLESVPQSVFAKGVGLWPMFLNETGRFVPTDEAPSNDLTAGALAQGLAAMFGGS